MIDKLISDLRELNDRVSEKMAKKLKLRLLERVILRLGFFSENCEACKIYIIDLNDQIEKLKSKNYELSNSDIKEYHLIERKSISHLQKEHKLVTEGYYAGFYMSIGTSFGLIFGLAIFDNLALGLGVGLSIGLAMGSARDADAKKKGLTI